MSGPLYLIDLRPDPAGLIRFAKEQGLNHHEDEDLGYAAHAWLTAQFGAGAIKPFRLLQDRRNLKPPRLLAYTRQSGEALAEYAQTHASPLAFQVCPLHEPIAAKPMPEHWREGRRLGFEVLACPISRMGSSEDDVYRRHLRVCAESNQPLKTQAEVYRQWLMKQFGTACVLVDFTLEGYRNISLLRKAGGKGRHDFTAPQALFAGELVVADSAAFSELLARGIGRHRAFGYGMLLLRPIASASGRELG